jgi:hypothetical protein
VPRRSKNPLLTGHTRRATLVEIWYTELLIGKTSIEAIVQQLTKGMKQSIQRLSSETF